MRSCRDRGGSGVGAMGGGWAGGRARDKDGVGCAVCTFSLTPSSGSLRDPGSATTAAAAVSRPSPPSSSPRMVGGHPGRDAVRSTTTSPAPSVGAHRTAKKDTHKMGTGEEVVGTGGDAAYASLRGEQACTRTAQTPLGVPLKPGGGDAGGAQAFAYGFVRVRQVEGRQPQRTRVTRKEEQKMWLRTCPLDMHPQVQGLAPVLHKRHQALSNPIKTRRMHHALPPQGPQAQKR
jgi:hypothetical protein